MIKNLFVSMHVYLKAVIKEEKCDLFPTVTWLVSQSDGFYSMDQTSMGWKQVGLEQDNVFKVRRQWRKKFCLIQQ